MFVTALYDIYNQPDKIHFYIELFQDLGSSGLPIIIFTEPSLVDKFSSFPNSVKVVGKPLDSFTLFSIGMKYNGELPSIRNNNKDTKEFFCLMNTKVEFLLEASKIITDSSINTFIWIDFGILKISNNKIEFIEKLHRIHLNTYDKIIIPGCHSFGYPFSVEKVNWRFCGGFCIVQRKYIQKFYDECKKVFCDFVYLLNYKLTWETNIWYIVEMYYMKNEIDWRLADHNNSIVNCI